MRGVAWLAVILVGACGGSEGPVSLSVVNYYGPAAEGVRVLGNDAAGDLVVERTTDAQGRAELDVPGGGSVSVVSPAIAMTIFAVEPGDELSFRMPPGTIQYISQQFVLPELPAGASSHEITAWCIWGGRDPGPATSVTTDGSCPPLHPVVDTARAADGRAIAHVVMPDQTLDTNQIVVPYAWVPPARRIQVDVAGIDLDDTAVGVDRWALLDGYRVHNDYSILREPTSQRTATLAVPDVGDSAYFTTTESQAVASTCLTHEKRVQLVTGVDDAQVTLDFARAPEPATSVSVSDDGTAVVWEGGSGGTAVHVLVTNPLEWYALVPSSYDVALLPRGLYSDQTGLLQPSNTLTVTRVASSQWSNYAEARAVRMALPSSSEYAPPLEPGEERYSGTARSAASCP